MTLYVVAFVCALVGALLGMLIMSLLVSAHEDVPSPQQVLRDEIATELGKLDPPMLPQARVAPQRPYSISVRRREMREWERNEASPHSEERFS